MVYTALKEPFSATACPAQPADRGYICSAGYDAYNRINLQVWCPNSSGNATYGDFAARCDRTRPTQRGCYICYLGKGLVGGCNPRIHMDSAFQ